MCDYFLLTKPRHANIHENDQHQFLYMDQKKVYLLPRNDIAHYQDHGLYEKDLIQWCSQFCSPDKVMLDIGAHCGTYTVSLADHCQHVYAFEPQKMTFYSLCGSVALSNILNATCISTGLGSEEQVGRQTLYKVSVDGGGSSVHTPPASTILGKEEIELKTLDSFSLENIGFIKIDVEGNELHVLQGARQTLEKSKYPTILFEMNKENQSLMDFVQSMGYHVSKVFGDNMYLATV